MIDLEPIKERYAATTQSEWEAGDVWVFTDPVYSDDRRLSNVLGMAFADETRAAAERERGLANARFIAAAHTDVPALVSEIERLRDEVAAHEFVNQLASGEATLDRTPRTVRTFTATVN